MNPLLLSVEEAAMSLGIGRSLAYEQIANGNLPHIKVGRRTLVPVAALAEAVNRMVLATRSATPLPESLRLGVKEPPSGGQPNRRRPSDARPRTQEVA